MPLRGGATASEVARVLSASQAAVFGGRLALLPTLAAQAVVRDCVGLTLAMMLAMAMLAMMKSPVAIGVMVLPPDAGVSQNSIVLNNHHIAAESMAVMYRSLSSQSDLPPAARRFIVAPEWHGRVHISQGGVGTWRGRGLPKESATLRASFV